MKAEYINPFLEATMTVMNSLCGVDTKFDNVYIREASYTVSDLIIIIGVTGKVRGQAILSMGEDTAKSIASYMMGGIPVESIDAMAKSAIGELGNMIMGNTCSIFYGRGIAIDITPPTILTGEKVEISNKFKTLCIPATLGEFGTMEIGVSAEEV